MVAVAVALVGAVKVVVAVLMGVATLAVHKEVQVVARVKVGVGGVEKARVVPVREAAAVSGKEAAAGWGWATGVEG